MVKTWPANAGDLSSVPGSGRSPPEKEWNPTPVFLPGEFRGQRSLAGYSPWSCERVRHDWMTKQLQQHNKTFILISLTPHDAIPVSFRFQHL